MDSDLEGNKACLVLQLVESPALSDEQACVQWIVSEPDPRVSSNDRKRIETLSKEIELLVKTKAVAPQLQENLDAEIMRKEAELKKLELILFGGVVFDTTEQMRNFEKKADELKVEVDKKKMEIEALQRKQKELQLKVKEKELEIAAIQRKQEEDKVMIESSEKQLAEKCSANEELEVSVRRLACELREKYLETDRELGEKYQLMEVAQKRHEADKLKSEEAHKLECDALRLKVERAEGLFTSYLSFFLKRFRTSFETALDETKAMSFQLSETHLRSTENARLAAGGQNEDENHPLKLESNTEPETAPAHCGDVTQTPVNLEKQKVERKRLRDVGQNLELTDRVRLQGNKEIASGRKRGKGQE